MQQSAYSLQSLTLKETPIPSKVRPMVKPCRNCSRVSLNWQQPVLLVSMGLCMQAASSFETKLYCVSDIETKLSTGNQRLQKRRVSPGVQLQPRPYVQIMVWLRLGVSIYSFIQSQWPLNIFPPLFSQMICIFLITLTTEGVMHKSSNSKNFIIISITFINILSLPGKVLNFAQSILPQSKILLNLIDLSNRSLNYQQLLVWAYQHQCWYHKNLISHMKLKRLMI